MTDRYGKTCIDNVAFDTLPTNLTACAVTVGGNNTEILTRCCGEGNVAFYGPYDSPACNLYCNFTTPTYEESGVFKCMEKANNLTGWVCQNEQKKSAASLVRNADKLVFAGIAVVILLSAVVSC
ncbi:hypothetical protein ONS95_003362 [Cadophora gregata]|uniref:uncharacterized protein n=1 Tax=Cadophora gregata TaxID=51156 RepID=UPI0026DD1EA4|nr:uncharacterized protein ONS95_003362 [Cadophora gregata]KAK0108564.1 hypothetical protein ONS95_003362 [Cadophora gregata]KAK0108842.1 hypothetical protein ONS96_002683 [Cadophora gregata f. sp. sojae]